MYHSHLTLRIFQLCGVFPFPLIMIYNNIQMDTYNYGFTQSHTLYHVSISLLCLLMYNLLYPRTAYMWRCKRDLISVLSLLIISNKLKGCERGIIFFKNFNKDFLANTFMKGIINLSNDSKIIILVEWGKYCWHWILFKIDWILHANNLSSLCLQNIFLTRHVYENN